MRLIDADELKEWECEKCEYENKDDTCKECCGVMQRIDEMPTIDAEPIVRCKDCKHYLEDGWGYGNCGRPNVDYLRMSEHDYCSWGKKR